MPNSPFLFAVAGVSIFIAIVLVMAFMSLDDASMSAGNPASQNDYLNILTILVGFGAVAVIGIGLWAGFEIFKNSQKSTTDEDEDEDEDGTKKRKTKETKKSEKAKSNGKKEQTDTTTKQAPKPPPSQSRRRPELKQATDVQAQRIDKEFTNVSSIEDQSTLANLVAFEQ
jgi:FtsZ-interacting cell division protein ZipA